MKSARLIALICWLALGTPTPAWAQVNPAQVEQNQLDRPGTNRDSRGSRDNIRVNERQAVNIIRQRHTGNVLRINLVGQGDNRRYQIRMENEGKVFNVFVNAITGEVSGDP